MGKVRIAEKKKIETLYKQGHGVREIAEKFSVSTDAMFYFFRSQNITRRTFGECREVLFKRSPLSFRINNQLTIKEEKLKLAGVVLYWGEGTKWKGAKTVEFVNSDMEMIRIFMRFMREVCGVDESKLRVLLYCHANQDVNTLQNFWSDVTGISLAQFTKPYIRKDYDARKEGKMKYGLIHVRYNDKKLLHQIMDWIAEIKSAY
tara:strand:- start:781 stop:1392 length:612 start_codon:yes stop_codon:yes gene_type:complete